MFMANKEFQSLLDTRFQIILNLLLKMSENDENISKK